MSTPLIINPEVREQLRALYQVAVALPVDVVRLTKSINTPEGKAAQMKQMTRQTVAVPMNFLVSFSIENGHPCGTCRHMSMSVQEVGRLPNQHAVWMIATELGFWGSLAECAIWQEELRGHGVAINIVQPIKPTSLN